ncbi:MAG: hypothetical protein DRP42_08005 [Tenericutes bacterium]|nr:MAG: hypothetical protein DRP42_08005 [Mycoplasmatota bacterium]
MACTPCPDYIKFAVRRPVSDALAQVNAIKKLTTALNAAMTGLMGDVKDAVAAVVDAIPAPPAFDLSEMLDLITCPLTPVAIGLNPALLASIDPRELFRLVQQQFNAYISEIRKNYEDALQALQEWNVVRILKQYLEDLKRVEFDEADFLVAGAIVIYVKAVCPDDEYLDGPYQAFEEAVTGWSLDGLIPTGLDSDVNDVMLELNRAEATFALWKALAVMPVPF